MKLFQSFRLLGSIGRAQAERAGDSITQLMVKFDPDAASEAQMNEYEHVVDQLSQKVAHQRPVYEKEQCEADQITARYSQLIAAGERLQQQINDPANAPRKAELEKSLETLLSQTEEMVEQMHQEQQDAKEAKESLDMFEQAATEAAAKLASGRQRLAKAKHDMERSEFEEERAKEGAENAAVLAGLRTHNDSADLVIGAMDSSIQKNRENTAALELKAKLLAGTAHKDLEQDPNIAAAMQEASGATHPPVSIADRLAALKANMQPAAA